MNNSGVNTIILVLILALAVGAAVWFLNKPSQEEKTDDVKVELTLPAGEDNSGSSN